MRKSLEDTWRYLEAIHPEVPRHSDGRPAVPDRVPSIFDEVPRLSFFRTGRDGTDLSHLTMPRTFFGRSLFERVSFASTDLSESCLCWNDFNDCDFAGADLSGCDLRASLFERCSFAGAVLRGADLRRSHFDGCDFAGADLYGAVVAHTAPWTRLRERLSPEQVAVVSWAEDAEPEPAGG